LLHLAKTLKSLVRLEYLDDTILPFERMILHECKKKSLDKNLITTLFSIYAKGVEDKISSENKNNSRVKEILEKRRDIVRAYIDLNNLVTGLECLSMENDIEDRIKNINTLMQKLYQHSQYICKNNSKLEKKGVSECYLLPEIFNLLADAFDYLGTLNWNSLNLKPKNEKFKIALDTIRYYKAGIYCLYEAEKYHCDLGDRYQKKITKAIQRTKDTFDEIRADLKDELNLNADILCKLTNLKQAIVDFLKYSPKYYLISDPNGKQTVKRKFTDSNSFNPNPLYFFKRPRIENRTEKGIDIAASERLRYGN
jgi:hypothetical protein